MGKTATNPITGDKIQTKPPTDAYLNNWDKIFKANKSVDSSTTKHK
jgi:hypothetical protein